MSAIAVNLSPKVPTGIIGFDEITGGGLPRGRTTLIEGGPGSGKTVMALQTLVNGARDYDEPAIFVAFEQSPEQILADAATFGWSMPAIMPQRLFMLDSRTDPDLILSGNFDLKGLLAILDAQVAAMGARRIVFDAIDVLLALLDPESARREMYRLNDWLLSRRLTAVITQKLPDDRAPDYIQRMGYLPFMVDCAVALAHDVVDGMSQRNLRVVKYRGSSFDENQVPFLITNAGIQVASMRSHDAPASIASTSERVSTGVGQLDDLLGGGYYRGASILITGSPGTAKTTLSGAFAEAAAKRGDRVVFVSFDSRADEVIRNLSSVGIDLAPYVEAGTLHVETARAISGSAEVHLMRIKEMVYKLQARCLVIDPLSALVKSGLTTISSNVVERLIDWSKTSGLTILCTSLLDHAAPDKEGSPLQISTIADTWIHLNYLVKAGERNRALSIVKSRGTAHSNQVRELILNHSGVSLSEVYTAGGEVLMGTTRWEKEHNERLERTLLTAEATRQRRELEVEAAELEGRLSTLQRELELKRDEQASFEQRSLAVTGERLDALEELRGRRSIFHGRPLVQNDV